MPGRAREHTCMDGIGSYPLQALDASAMLCDRPNLADDLAGWGIVRLQGICAMMDRCTDIVLAGGNIRLSASCLVRAVKARLAPSQSVASHLQLALNAN